ncbi:hypothetical protein NUU61_003292 [Penicillium alfredii]|uniref:Protein kinase domain-containing protein n=1 Tax=Penicillium alfredii TaxID=1506179 RepID=A0A9W9KGS5_9EURO|nr:uncharacterized protein NUU61_003292 [Penicillium alfredii]KAJ5105945.1 hypothetical protein NUU61_003292 [Penicillium alfredii]
MAHQEPTSLWWPEDRIASTLDTTYIVSHLQPANVPRLFDLPRWGEGLTSETYMEWILLKAGRLFLTLSAIGIPDRIFALVDESCDDADLPVPEHSVDLLQLAADGAPDPALDSRFFHAQWRFLVRGIAEGEHVAYTANEGVPVEVLRPGSSASTSVQGRDNSVDRVVLAGSVCRVFLRTCVQVGGAPHFFEADEVLGEIRALRRLAHEHVMSVYGSYQADDTICVLFTGASADRTLHSFLTDEPLAFKRQSKEQRRQTLIQWPHCLASGLAWLHARGHSHGAIRPSNILVDAGLHIRLGQFQALDSLLAPPRVDDLEAYQYSAPERWIRSAAPLPQPAPSRILLPSGGRTARKKRPSRLTLTPLNESPPSSPDFPRPDSAASRGTVIRIGLPGSPSRFSFAFSSSSSSASSAASSSAGQDVDPWKQQQQQRHEKKSQQQESQQGRTRIWSKMPKSLIATPSLTSSFASHRSARNRSAGRGGGIADASFHLARNVVQVQSWIALLEGDALKRCRRDRGSDKPFWAVPRLLMVLRAMLDADAEKRPEARRVKRCFANAVCQQIPGGVVALHCRGGKSGSDEVKEKKRLVNKEMGEMEEKSKKKNARSKLRHDASASSVSDFDFGFSDPGSGSDTNIDDDEENNANHAEAVSIKQEEPEMQTQRESPQLALPDFDINITGIEGLTLASK